MPGGACKAPWRPFPEISCLCFEEPEANTNQPEKEKRRKLNEGRALQDTCSHEHAGIMVTYSPTSLISFPPTPHLGNQLEGSLRFLVWVLVLHGKEFGS